MTTFQSITTAVRFVSRIAWPMASVPAVAFLAIVGIASASQGALIATDSFATTAGGSDYNVGQLYGQNPTVGLSGFTGGWTTGGSATGANQAANGGLTHPNLAGSALAGQEIPSSTVGAATRRVSRAINYVPTDGTYYMSVLMRKTAATSTLDALAGLSPLESHAVDLTTGSQATAIGIYNGGIGLLTPGNAYTLLTETQMNVNETYMGVMRIDFSTTGTDSVTVAVVNGLGTTIFADQYAGLNLDGRIGRFAAISSDLGPTVGIDEFRFGTLLSDVGTNISLSAVPEPSTISMLLVGMVALATRRRRKN